MNFENVVKSFFLGLVIGVVLQSLRGAPSDISLAVVSVLVSGALGFLIGLVTEWITSLLPLRIARTRTYFFVNNLIAISITALVMVILVLTADEATRAAWNWWSVTGVIVSIVCVANVADYVMYQRAQRRLRALQATLLDAESGDSRDLT